MFRGVKVFSATKAREREVLGEKVTAWLRANPTAEVVDKALRLTSDNEFHCLSITLFFNWRQDGESETTKTPKPGGKRTPSPHVSHLKKR